MLQGTAFVAIVTAAITSTFVARAQAQRDGDDTSAAARAAHRVDLRLEDITARLDRVEQMLSKLSDSSRTDRGH